MISPRLNWKESDPGYRLTGAHVSAAQREAGAIHAARLEAKADERARVVAAAHRSAKRFGLDLDQFGQVLREELSR